MFGVPFMKRIGVTELVTFQAEGYGCRFYTECRAVVKTREQREQKHQAGSFNSPHHNTASHTTSPTTQGCLSQPHMRLHHLPITSIWRPTIPEQWAIEKHTISL